MRPQPRVQMKKAHERSHHGHTGTRHSPRNGFTAYSALSPATNSSCHRHRRIKGFAGPGRARNTSANLTPATGARTTRLCRTPQHRSSARCRSLTENRPATTIARLTLPRPPLPAPTFVTMANAPLSGRDARICRDDLPDGESGIFLQRGLDNPTIQWTARSLICPSG